MVHESVSFLYVKTIDMIVRELKEKSEIFKRMFDENIDFENLAADDQTAVRTAFDEINCGETFENFLEKWKTILLPETSLPETSLPPETAVPSETPFSSLCKDQLIFNAQLRKMQVSVVRPVKNKQRQEFDVYKFIVQKEAEQDVHRLHIEPESQDAASERSLEESLMLEINADYNLRKVAQIVHLINRVGDYALLQCQGERRII